MTKGYIELNGRFVSIENQNFTAFKLIDLTFKQQEIFIEQKYFKNADKIIQEIKKYKLERLSSEFHKKHMIPIKNGEDLFRHICALIEDISEHMLLVVAIPSHILWGVVP